MPVSTLMCKTGFPESFGKTNCIFVLYELFLREKGLNPSFIEGMLVYQEKIPHCKRGVAEDLISNDG